MPSNCFIASAFTNTICEQHLVERHRPSNLKGSIPHFSIHYIKTEFSCIMQKISLAEGTNETMSL